MRSKTLWAIGMTIGALTGCSQHTTENVPATTTSSAATSTPAKPAQDADENAWSIYLAAQGKIHGKDVPGKPYIYVIQSGDSIAATKRRAEELDSIPHSIGPILIPGSLLILGGPSSAQTDAFIATLAKQLKPNSLNGIVVLIVDDAKQNAAIENALKVSGATVRFVAM